MTQGKHILVIEDHEEQRTIAMVFLEHFGYEVKTAASAEQALRLTKGWRPDLVVLDLMMPNEDGVAVLRRLRAEPATAQVPVVAYSGYTDLFKGQLEECAAVLSKAAGLQRLLRAVQAQLGDTATAPS